MSKVFGSQIPQGDLEKDGHQQQNKFPPVTGMMVVADNSEAERLLKLVNLWRQGVEWWGRWSGHNSSMNKLMTERHRMHYCWRCVDMTLLPKKSLPECMVVRVSYKETVPPGWNLVCLMPGEDLNSTHSSRKWPALCVAVLDWHQGEPLPSCFHYIPICLGLWSSHNPIIGHQATNVLPFRW